MEESAESVRFPTVSESSIQELLRDKHSENTRNATKMAVACFTSYLRIRKYPDNFESLPKETLGPILKQFYCEARKRNGDYKRSALISIRSGLNRHLQSTNQNIDFISDPAFIAANEVFTARKVELKKLGKGQIAHHMDISEDDMQLLYSSGAFALSTAQTLQYKVFFELMLYICRRGRENLRTLTPEHFKIAQDLDGRRYLFQAKDELRKNRREDDDCKSEGGRMYAIPGNIMCPVASYEKYLCKLNPLCS